jgi:hypothetical protein
VITIDADAAGWGWFTDAFDGPVTVGRIDLVRVLEHELGHALGLDDADVGVMDASLAPGVRVAAIRALDVRFETRPAATERLRGVPAVTHASHFRLVRRPLAIRRMHPSTRGGRS